MATERWEETNRREVGVVAGQSRDVGAYFAIVYMVNECRKERGKMVEWRERLVHGPTIYQHKHATVAGRAALEMVASGVEALKHLARTEDARATSRRKAR